MKQKTVLIKLFTISIATTLLSIGCASKQQGKTDPVEANIKIYTAIWDEIINKGKLDLINESNFTKDLVMHEGAMDVVGVDSARAYYANFITGFSNIAFTIKDVFGQGDKLVKYWNFKGRHTGIFFGIPATGKTVNLDGVTLVRMENGKIAIVENLKNGIGFGSSEFHVIRSSDKVLPKFIFYCL